MKGDIKPKYEILFNDLKNHMIGDFLISREFKMVMSQNGFYEWWQSIYKEIKENRHYFALGIEHNRGDNIDTLAAFLNEVYGNEKVENFVTLIIISFIDYKKQMKIFLILLRQCWLLNFQKMQLLRYKMHLINIRN
jgi:hypothetical protein